VWWCGGVVNIYGLALHLGMLSNYFEFFVRLRIRKCLWMEKPICHLLVTKQMSRNLWYMLLSRYFLILIFSSWYLSYLYHNVLFAIHQLLHCYFFLGGQSCFQVSFGICKCSFRLDMGTGNLDAYASICVTDPYGLHSLPNLLFGSLLTWSIPL